MTLRMIDHKTFSLFGAGFAPHGVIARSNAQDNLYCICKRAVHIASGH